MERARILIASPFPHFLAEHMPSLTGQFDIQRANSEDVVSFLGKEWMPHVLMIDGDSLLFNCINKFRARFPMETLGIIVISREYTAAREERAFKGGCDQMVPYPNSSDALNLRLSALCIRVSTGVPATRFASPEDEVSLTPDRAEPVHFGDLRIFPHDHLLKRGDQIVTLTPIQFKLLLLFLQHRDQLLSRQQIKEHVWQGAEISLRSIDAQISKLRKIIPELDPHLMNIYGKGYVFAEGRQQAA